MLWPTRPAAGTSLDIALDGTATASTEATGSPASNAIDGSASTLVLDPVDRLA